MSKTGASFSIRVLRNGDNIFVVRDIVNENGEGAGLFQSVDPNTGVTAPDWSVSTNQPIVRISVRSSIGYVAEITGVTWAYDGGTLKFPPLTSVFQTSTNNSSFAARVNGQYYELRVIDNLAGTSVLSNQQINYEVRYMCNALSDIIRGSVDVLILAAGTDSHMLQITTNRVEIDTTNPTATLTAIGIHGVEQITIGENGYSVKWYQDDIELTGKTKSTLIVDREMVTGGSIFVAKLFLNGNAVAQDGQRINDISDEYQITYTAENAGSNYVGDGHNAYFVLSVTKNGKPLSEDVTFTWQIYDAQGVAKTGGDGNMVTVTPNDCLVSTGSGDYYADCDVQVTASW